jgi:hypothetical protein
MTRVARHHGGKDGNKADVLDGRNPPGHNAAAGAVVVASVGLDLGRRVGDAAPAPAVRRVRGAEGTGPPAELTDRPAASLRPRVPAAAVPASSPPGLCFRP